MSAGRRLALAALLAGPVAARAAPLPDADPLASPGEYSFAPAAATGGTGGAGGAVGAGGAGGAVETTVGSRGGRGTAIALESAPIGGIARVFAEGGQADLPIARHGPTLRQQDALVGVTAALPGRSAITVGIGETRDGIGGWPRF